MSDRLPHTPRLGPPLAAALAAVLLWLLHAATARSPLFGQYPERAAIEMMAVVATALLFVLGGGSLILYLARPAGATTQQTGLQRAVIYGVLTFVASSVALRHFGFDLGGVLTTSAIVTAAIGLAMQPTLGSLISGLALSADRTLRVGDGVMLGGEVIRVEALTWRNAVGRKADGHVVVLPNARLSNSDLEILPRDRPIRAEAVFKAPKSVPPQRVHDLVVELIGDLGPVDATRPIEVAPTECEVDGGTTRYRVRYWVRRYGDTAALDGEVMRRLWYGFQRHRLYVPPPRPEGGGASLPTEWGEPAELAPLIAASLRSCVVLERAAGVEEAAQTLAKDGEVLLYAPGERIIVPDRMEGWSFLLLRGAAVAAEFDMLDPGGVDPAGLPFWRLGRGAAVRHLAEELAQRIGPYAEHAVRRAARTAADLDDLCVAVASEIPDEAARARFLLDVRPERPAAHQPGLLFRARRDAAGRLECEERLRACDEMMVLAIRPALLDEAVFAP